MKRFLFVCFGISSALFAMPFNNRLSDKELNDLENGKAVIRNFDSIKDTCLDSSISKDSAVLFEHVKKINPKYIAEVIKIIPYQGNENYAETLCELLSAPGQFTNIPYVTDSGGKYFLYDKADVAEEHTENGITYQKLEMYMEPFGNLNEDIELHKTEDTIIYLSNNTNKLRYRDQIDCLKPEQFMIDLYLFRNSDENGDNWILYTIGGVHAPHVPVVSGKIRNSFMKRIRTFCEFVMGK